MPEMDGLQATSAIRQREARQPGWRLPIIARERCLAAGMDGYLSKPVRPEALTATIARLVGDTESRPTGSETPAPALSPAAPPLDLAAALEAAGGDQALLAEVATLFLDECPRRLEELRQAVVSGDGPGTERAAHALKGALANFGARTACARAAELETLGRQADLAAAPPVLAALEQELQRATSLLTEPAWTNRV